MADQTSTTTLTVADTAKMLRETLALAQTRMALSGDPRPHMHRLQRLIDECDRHRPLGPNGKHGYGERCTPTCGCDRQATAVDQAATFDPFAGKVTGWRAAPDCAKCNDTGRANTGGCCGPRINTHCTCKTGRRRSELWYADKHGLHHPDAPEPEPDYEAHDGH